ncbi:YrhK family protein [Pseudonocardia saturnea]
MNRTRLEQVATEFKWLHQGIGVLGGVTFFVGSILFLYDGLLQRVAVWLFIVGSAGMLVGNVGNALITYERHELEDTSSRGGTAAR